MKNKRLKIRGFTLIEMVTTISIISILTVMGVPAFYRYNQDNAPKMAAEDIKSYLTEAQSLAQSPAIGDSDADYYYVHLSPEGKLKLDNSLNNPDPIKKMEIDSDAKILSITPSVPNEGITYYFKVPTGEILFNDSEVAKGTSVIKIISSAGEGFSDQSVIVDGTGGSIKNVNCLYPCNLNL